MGWRSRSAEPSATLKNQSGINGLLPSLAALGGPLHLFRLLLDLCSRVQQRVAVTFPQEKSLLDFPEVGIAQTPIRRFVAAMTPEELFTAALGLGQQWRVVECRFEGEPKRLELRLEHVRGQPFECPQCGTLCGVHDTIEWRWRHLNFFQYRCELVAKVPRTWCRTDGVHQVQVPWGREGSGFTLLMEALMMLLSAEMPVDAMAGLLDEHGSIGMEF